MKRILLASLLAVLAGCGGGGGGGSNTPQQPPLIEPRGGIEYGYFGDTCNVPKTAPHTTFQMVAGWCESGSLIDQAVQAQAAGQKIVVLLNAFDESSLRTLFDSLRNANVLSSVLAFQVGDEPDAHGLNDATVRGMNATVRRVAAEYYELKDVKLWVIYGQYGTPAADSFDACGHDDYGTGPKFPPACKQIILIPGGASPWREDPTSFLNAAYTDYRVVAIMPFIWHWPQEHIGDGIENNGMARKYCEIGSHLIEPAAPTHCE